MRCRTCLKSINWRLPAATAWSICSGANTLAPLGFDEVAPPGVNSAGVALAKLGNGCCKCLVPVGALPTSHPSAVKTLSPEMARDGAAVQPAPLGGNGFNAEAIGPTKRWFPLS